jgi:hypothetical protein
VEERRVGSDRDSLSHRVLCMDMSSMLAFVSLGIGYEFKDPLLALGGMLVVGEGVQAALCVAGGFRAPAA